MVTSSQAPASAELDRKNRVLANSGPMTQQGAMGAQGHEMHPQGFLRLVGCHENGRSKQDLTEHPRV